MTPLRSTLFVERTSPTKNVHLGAGNFPPLMKGTSNLVPLWVLQICSPFIGASNLRQGAVKRRNIWLARLSALLRPLWRVLGGVGILTVG